MCETHRHSGSTASATMPRAARDAVLEAPAEQPASLSRLEAPKALPSTERVARDSASIPASVRIELETPPVRPVERREPAPLKPIDSIKPAELLRESTRPDADVLRMRVTESLDKAVAEEGKYRNPDARQARDWQITVLAEIYGIVGAYKPMFREFHSPSARARFERQIDSFLRDLFGLKLNELKFPEFMKGGKP